MIGNGSAKGAASADIPVVIMENRPFLADEDIRTLCNERLGWAPDRFELVSIACLKHFLKNSEARDALASYLRQIGERGRTADALVISAGGSHKTAVRLLKAARSGLAVHGITVADRGPRRGATALISWSDSSLHGDGALRSSTIEAFDVRGPLHLLSVPTPAHVLRDGAVWQDVLLSGLRHLCGFGLKRAILLGDVLRYGRGIDAFIPVTDLIAVQQRMKDALPDITVDIAGLTDRTPDGPRVRCLIADTSTAT